MRLTWCTCILKLIAVQVENRDKVKQMCAYTCLVIQEARKHGGDGWSAYDRLLRHHAAANLDLPRATLDDSIHAATFLVSRTGMGTHYRLCADSDNLAHECALAPILNSKQPAHYTVSQSSHHKAWPGSPSNTSTCPICNSWPGGNAHIHLSAATDMSVPHTSARRAPTRRKTVPTLPPTAFSAGLLHHLTKAAGRVEPDQHIEYVWCLQDIVCCYLFACTVFPRIVPACRIVSALE